MKLGIGIPYRSSIKVVTMMSLIVAVQRLGEGAEIFFCAKPGALVHWNREEIFEIARLAGCTHLLFLDTDMKFPAVTFQKLLDLDRDIVGVLSFKRALPLIPTVHVSDEQAPNGWRNAAIEEIPSRPFNEISGRSIAVGTGIMLINMARAERVAQPRFKAEWQGLGEDVYFCAQAIAAGLGVWCDPTIPIKHIGDFDY